MARILLADDDKGALDLVRRALAMDGHAVTTVDDGNDAQSVLDGASFDVIVADVDMPGVDGIELAGLAKAQIAGIGIVFISGSQELLDKARSAGLGKVRLVIKPFTIEKIRSEVRAVLGN
ncbi:MAG: response regulator transcription factor [Hyphomicrobiaceae bacterium]